MDTSFKPYEGSESYIFVSYARNDSKQVASLLDTLNLAGYRVWYDSGIQSGKRWMDSLAEHITGCSVFMPLISAAFADSVNCYDETTYALTKKCLILPVYLEDNVTLPPGLEMRLYSLQWRKLSDYDGNVTRFTQSLEHEELLKPCHQKIDAEKTSASAQGFPKKEPFTHHDSEATRGLIFSVTFMLILFLTLFIIPNCFANAKSALGILWIFTDLALVFLLSLIRI